MMSQLEFLEKFPINEQTQAMFQKKQLLQVLFEPQSNGKTNEMIVTMCRDNIKMTKKVAKSLLKKFSQQTDPEKLTPHLRALKKFLLINDTLKSHRMEWIFGVPQIYTRRNLQVEGQCKMQREFITQINDEAFTFQSALLGYTQSDAFLTKIQMCQGKMDTFCLKGLKDLIKLCVKDEDIARYIFSFPGQTLQWHRFIDWFEGYLNYQAVE